MEKITEITTFKQIKEIIEPIPADQFCKDTYQNNKGQCCFLGHIQRHISGDAGSGFEGYGARELTRLFLKAKHNINNDGSGVNNRPNINGYRELIIKNRLMHMINDGIKWEQAKINAERRAANREAREQIRDDMARD